MITITGVDVSPDFSHAKVFFTTLDPAHVGGRRRGPEARRRFPALAARAGASSSTPRRSCASSTTSRSSAATGFRASSTARRRRMIDGALLLDKPVGLTSNAALQKAKKALGAAKAGHAGTLDPLASGLLIALFGEATKFAGPLLDADKEYVATLEARRAAPPPVTPRARSSRPSRSRHRGRLPRYWKASRARSSRCRRCIRRSSTRARRSTGSRGAARKSRARRAGCASRSSKCSNPKPPRLVLRVVCSKGTYIRALAEDIGEALGCGAHLAGLRRTGSGRFRVEDALTWTRSKLCRSRAPRALLPLTRALRGSAARRADRGTRKRACAKGQALKISGRARACARWCGPDGGVIGLAEADGHGGSEAAAAHPNG